MTDKIIAIEEENGPFQAVLQGVMRLVPERDQTDKSLLRLIAFRLKIDGEKLTRQYLSTKIRDFSQQSDFDRLFDFLHEDMELKKSGNTSDDTEPPEIA